MRCKKQAIKHCEKGDCIKKMKKTAPILCLLAVLLFWLPMVTLGDTDEDTISQQEEIEALKTRLSDLENKLNEILSAQPLNVGVGQQEDIESLKSDMQQIKDILTEPEGAIQTTISDVSKLKKIKVSGYIQGRFEAYEKVAGEKNKGDNKTSDNRFYLRRARFKITGQPTDKTLGLVQLDISGYDRSKVESKDVYLEYHPWSIGVKAPFFVRVGQQSVPFGYIIERSSSAREVPERAKVFAGTTVGLPGYPSFNGLFPGERDKGIALLNTDGSKVEWAVAILNGTGTKAGDAGKAFLESGGKFEDNNTGKAFVGRVRYPILENLNVGVSAYSGSQAVRVVSNAPSAVNVSQTRYGADFQLYLSGASLKGEYVTGKEPYYSNTSTTPNGKSGKNRTVSGWYLMGVKNLGVKNQLVAQYDVLDDEAMASTFGKLSSWNLGVIHFLDDATKVKLFYEINKEERNSVRNDGLRFEVLTVF